MPNEEPNWPYERIEALEHEPEPTWECPEGICTCAEINEAHKDWQFSVMLCEPDGTRMRNARCRVVVNGMLANEDDPNADSEGWITVAMHHVPTSVLVEWAPHNTPRRSPYPHRRRYYVDLREDDDNERARRRLHNLGFSVQPTLRENIEDFELEYGYPELTGEVSTIWDDLHDYHDQAMVPLRDRESRERSDYRLAFFSPQGEPTVAGPGTGGKAVPQKPPAAPKDKGKQNAGQGTVKTAISPEIFMRSIVDVYDSGDAVYDWQPIYVYYKRKPSDTWDQTFRATFWVFKDALKDKKTNLRWPCSAAEAQIVADKLKVGPGPLPGWRHLDLGDEKLSCLLLTTRLMDARWLHARDRFKEIIPPHPKEVWDLLISSSTRMNRAIEADLAALGKPDPWVADPGKIWAIHYRLWDGTAKGAVNYGWHVDPPSVKKSTTTSEMQSGGIRVVPNTAIPGLWVVQDAGGQHNAYHIDYSQILLLVAPYCTVAKPGETYEAPMFTEQVYRSAELACLVTDNALPLKDVRQPFDPAIVARTKIKYWEEQEGIYREKKRKGLGVMDPMPPPAKYRTK